MNSNTPPNFQESSQPGEAIANLVNDIHDLTGKVDSFALSFTLAWKHSHDPQRQFSPITAIQERTNP
jgi:hypothetical protein